MAIAITVIDEQSDRPVDVARFEHLALDVVSELAVGADVELSVRFVDEATITELNERYLGHVGRTDVLSFPIEDDLRVDDATPASIPVMLGDVVICPVVAEAQAPEHGATYLGELALLLVHGILHLVGMDHEVDGDAQAMEEKEQQLLASHFAAPR